MILPILAYGKLELRKVAKDITETYPCLQEFINDLFETMYTAHGVGLAAPQVGKCIRLFVVDTAPFAEDEPELKNFKKVFINPCIEHESGNMWSFNEGCLSIPDIREDVSRHTDLTISYYDANWHFHRENYSGLAARVIQHEYDHIEGKLFTDKISPLKKRMIEKKLLNISQGKVNVDYKMIFPSVNKKR